MCHGVTRDFSLTAHRLWWPTWVFLRSPTTQQAGRQLRQLLILIRHPVWASPHKPREAGETHAVTQAQPSAGGAVFDRKAHLNLLVLMPHSPREKCSSLFENMPVTLQANQSQVSACLSELSHFEARFTNTDECVSSLKQRTLTWNTLQVYTFNDKNISYTFSFTVKPVRMITSQTQHHKCLQYHLRSVVFYHFIMTLKLQQLVN